MVAVLPVVPAFTGRPPTRTENLAAIEGATQLLVILAIVWLLLRMQRRKLATTATSPSSKSSEWIPNLRRYVAGATHWMRLSMLPRAIAVMLLIIPPSAKQ